MLVSHLISHLSRLGNVKLVIYDQLNSQYHTHFHIHVLARR